MNESEFLKWFDRKREEHFRRLSPSVPLKPVYPLGVMPIHRYLMVRAVENPDKTALIYYGTRITYGELNAMANKFANYLIDSLRVGKGDRVGIVLPNCPDFYITYYGILKAGGVAPLYSVMYREMELRHLLKVSRPRAIVVADNLVPMLRRVVNEVDPSIKLICASDLDFLPTTPELPVHESMKRSKDCGGELDLITILRSSDYSDEEPTVEHTEVDVSVNDPAVMLFTSGTTGLPKAVVHKHFGILYKQAAAFTYGPYDYLIPRGREFDYRVFLNEVAKSEVRLVVLPIYWVAGKDFGLDSLPVVGYTAVLLARYDPRVVLLAIHKYRVTYTYLTFDAYLDILNSPLINEVDRSSLRFAAGSSFIARLNRELRRKFNSFFPNAVIYEASYGLTETHTYDVINLGMLLDDLDLALRERYGSLAVGPTVPGTYVKILDPETGELLPPGKPGVIWIRSPALVEGYLERPEETTRDFRDGWFNTGDYGLVDENGYLHFIQRIKDMIKVSGVSVSPVLVEEELKELAPEIREVAVIGAKDPETGEAPIAFVALKDEFRGKITEEEILNRCRGKMSRYHIPRRVIFMDQLPKTPSGKIVKEDLKRAWEELKNK
ncbi:AMP-binding protein [Vulcanisaeta souniana]|uniref:Acyl-CoA synthetase n=2 Tax=Vulcanisaeta souniana JCM 11219 TaxID=1293586 RepID=A0ABM8BK96_9CREN|nr:AMP-binding protein [Vulcanisaeta souniana]BDR91374.1 acyl-CoA synthetase [Vulcanisaeta souniana JCM 11219]